MSVYPLMLIIATANINLRRSSHPLCLCPAPMEAAPPSYSNAGTGASAQFRHCSCAFAGGVDTYGDERETSPATYVPVLKLTHVASLGAMTEPDKAQPWQVEVVARFKTPSGIAPIQVVLLDKADPDAIAKKEAIIIWDVYTWPTELVAMRFEVAPRGWLRARTRRPAAFRSDEPVRRRHS